jgi:hypothetical protein
MQSFENLFRERGLADKRDTQLTTPATRLSDEVSHTTNGAMIRRARASR